MLLSAWASGLSLALTSLKMPLLSRMPAQKRQLESSLHEGLSGLRMTQTSGKSEMNIQPCSAFGCLFSSVMSGGKVISGLLPALIMLSRLFGAVWERRGFGFGPRESAVEEMSITHDLSRQH